MLKKQTKQIKSDRTMSRAELIKQIGKERNSAVIAYITGDRPNFSTKISNDVIPLLFRHLELIGKKDNIDLFLYTRGGEMVVPIRIVKLIRNYCKKFGVIVAYRAHSAGTLIALGADEIVMGKLGELTPVDPTAEAHPFNPTDPVDKNKPLPVSVEDVRSYLLFAKEELKGKDEQLVELYSRMTNQSYPNPMHLHPLALGNVYRAQRMIKILAKKLLSLHINVKKESNKNVVEKIVKEITADICIHNYPIYRDEAKSLGMKVIIPKEEVEAKMWLLYERYAQDMELTKQFNPLELLGQNNALNIKYSAAYIESEKAQDTFYYDIRINKVMAAQAPGQPPLPAVNVNVAGFAWEKVK